MPFVKIHKNNTYYKRFQVKFRRRREGKTDYYQRKRMITQRKNKYNTPKWRFVVRRTNQKIICQVVYSTIAGDKIKTSANSTELKRYGLEAGLSNYSAAYCTGLLTARRLLTQLDTENKQRDITLNYAKDFNLVPETTGEYVDIAALAEKKGLSRPFTCFLDLGLARATVGNRVFAAMKGAVDGGIHIPHSDKIFPKVKEDAKKDKKAGDKKDASTANPLRDRIFGQHVQTYMDLLKKDAALFKKQFSKWEGALIKSGAKSLPELYKKVHAGIRANPIKPKKDTKPKTATKTDPKNPNIVISAKKPYRRDRKLKNEDRKKRVAEKIQKFFNDRNNK
jgi:large subunit ribosomal protein L5e